MTEGKKSKPKKQFTKSFFDQSLPNESKQNKQVRSFLGTKQDAYLEKINEIFELNLNRDVKNLGDN